MLQKFVSGLVCLLLAPVAPQDDQDATQRIEKLGGSVRRLDLDNVVYEVKLQGTKVTDADLALIAKMKGLVYVDLSFTGVSDKGVAHLTGAAELSGLNLNGTRVTDAVIEHLRRLPKLAGVELAQTGVTDKGVAQLTQGRSLYVCRAGLGPKALYRVHQKYADGILEHNFLMIGTTHYGMYLMGKKGGPDRRREATTYYHRDGPVGQVMAGLEWFKPAAARDYPSDARLAASLVGQLIPCAPSKTPPLTWGWGEPPVGVIRLNVGTHAAYGRPCQQMHFYNSTPEIASFSLPPKGETAHFGFIQDAQKRGCVIKVFEGDERETLARKGPKEYYAALFVEPTRDDELDILTKLMTQEAVAEMMASLTEKGVLCFHTSHRTHQLWMPVIDAAKALNLSWKLGRDMGEQGGDPSHFSSEWLMVARKAEYLAHLVDVKDDNQKVRLGWTVPDATGKHLWRDGQAHDLKALAHGAVAPPVAPQDDQAARQRVEKLGGTVKLQAWPKDKEAYSVDLRGTKAADADLAVVVKLKGLHSLDLAFTNVTNAGVADLAAAADLNAVDLSGTRVTDAAIADLRRVGKLYEVGLAQTGVTDKGVAKLVQGRSMTVSRVGLGPKAQYRVHQRYNFGELEHNFLMVGDTHFGLYQVGKSQPKDPDRRREATTYYHRQGPVGQVMGGLEWFRPGGLVDYPSDARLAASLVGQLIPCAPAKAPPLTWGWSEPPVGVIRLNVGTHAAYGRPYQQMHFYNSTPEIASFSLPPKGEPAYFGFIEDARKRGCVVKVFEGDERETLTRKGPKKFYAALFVEPTLNDLREINTKLLTQEGVAELMGSLAERGVLCFHTSHRYYQLPKVIVDAAKALNLSWKLGKDRGFDNRNETSHFSSEWLMIARKAEYLSHLVDVKGENNEVRLSWTEPAATGMHLWRDGQPHDLKALEFKRE